MPDIREALLAGIVSLSILLIVKIRKRRILPPGPAGMPIAGNAFNIPRSFEWLTYRRWSKDYHSDVIYLRIFGTHVVVLNSYEAVHDLLDKRSAIYSDRYHQIMLRDLVGWDQNMTFMCYDEAWKERRKQFHQYYHGEESQKYRPNSSLETKRLLCSLIRSPEHFFGHLRTMMGSTILEATFGFPIKAEDDPFVILAHKALYSLAMVGNTGSYLVDYFPILRYLPAWAPGAQFKRDALAWKILVTEMFERPIQVVKQSLASGDARPSVASAMLGEIDSSRDHSEAEAVIRSVTGTAYVGGTDTSVSSLWSFVLAMLLYPEVQSCAQAELDRIVGVDRLPEHDDKESLPYIKAIVLESLRWHPVAPLAVPHRLMIDDEYNGFHLPAGSIVIGNTWALLHDEDVFEDPETFDPARFLTSEGDLDERMADRAEVAFGYGRRICPGRHFALDTLWIAMAHVLSAFKIEKAANSSGMAIEPKAEFTPGILSFPVPFEAKFTPRTAAMKALIETLVIPE